MPLSSPTITTLFLDIGGVLLTNGWDRDARARAAANFQLDLKELDQRHHLAFDAYEIGKLSLDEYLERTVFHLPRQFSSEDFRGFMFAQSNTLPGMIELVHELKNRHKLRVHAVSNEGRELTDYRIRKFGLRELFDAFVCSCFVGLRKPDPAIYRMAIDIAQTELDEVVYLDDRAMFVDVASKMGIKGITHQSIEATKKKLELLGLQV